MWWRTSWHSCDCDHWLHSGCSCGLHIVASETRSSCLCGRRAWSYVCTHKQTENVHADFSWVCIPVSVSTIKTSYFRAYNQNSDSVWDLEGEICVYVCVCGRGGVFVWSDRGSSNLLIVLINVSFCMTDIIPSLVCQSTAGTWDSVDVCVSLPTTSSLSAMLLIFTHSSLMANVKTEGKQWLFLFLETIRQQYLDQIANKHSNPRPCVHRLSHLFTQISDVLMCLVFRRTHMHSLDSFCIQRKKSSRIDC
jgi:hypothetical protein